MTEEVLLKAHSYTVTVNNFLHSYLKDRRPGHAMAFRTQDSLVDHLLLSQRHSVAVLRMDLQHGHRMGQSTSKQTHPTSRDLCQRTSAEIVPMSSIPLGNSSGNPTDSNPYSNTTRCESLHAPPVVRRFRKGVHLSNAWHSFESRLL